MNDLKVTYILAGIIFIGLVGWNVYFEEEFDQFREPYTVEDREETVEVDTSSEEEAFVYGVSAVHPLAVEAGMKVLNQGGNAAEAAIAVSFVLNVVEPYGSGIGGGGQMIVHEPDEGAITYDYREAAPISGARPQRGIAVPGFVKGMEAVYEDYGDEMEWSALLEDAVTHSEEGIQVGRIFHEQLQNSQRFIQSGNENPEIYSMFYPEDRPLQINDMLVQEELAATLKDLQENGPEAFYEGKIADSLTSQLGFEPGDLAAYEVGKRTAPKGEFKGQTLYAGSSPTSGIIVIQALKMLEQLESNLEEVLKEEYALPGGDWPAFLNGNVPESLEEIVNDPQYEDVYIHLVNKIVNRVYTDRVYTLGDPAFEEVDQEKLTSTEYAEELFQEEFSLGEDNLTSSADLYTAPGEKEDNRNTTHFVIVDKDGMMVSTTNSLGKFFGSGLYVDGFFLNHQMNNFDTAEDAMNSYEPGKRPRSFVSPMIFESDGRAVLGIGSPGGKRIPAMLIQTLIQYEYGINEDTGEQLTLQEAISRSRFYTEDNVVHVENLIEQAPIARLRDMKGYSVIEHDSPVFYGGIQGLGIRTNGDVLQMYGGGDPRRLGTWQIGNQDGMDDVSTAE
ncbi:gamma-glutamyltranspeptidase / glutathione hydrolase [Halobacillus dabanensis]|uniref:Gamma-glutamyltranspeptidase / glutathione hydrolase n=1 Tax=Halobacillus dabanensis TaxID=240302 RepID=A0A1I3U4N3_HALDA|nr:gamma-glutamyltransferase [Halobacillus dabanensis]SFJ77882.1 gamma-glutamyltranspeptidase / glutathione hydrolase [Halobacillus dabanensis]